MAMPSATATPPTAHHSNDADHGDLLTIFAAVIQPPPTTEATRTTHEQANLGCSGCVTTIATMMHNASSRHTTDAQALTSGHLGGAALDTVHQEPLPAQDPLWDAPNLIITPHLGGFYDTYPEDSMEQISFNIRTFLGGRFEEMINQEAR